jgi:hypothetical protein
VLLRISNAKYPPYAIASFTALFANYFVIGQTGYGIWQNWWVGSAILASAFLLLSASVGREENVDKSANKGFK